MFANPRDHRVDTRRSIRRALRHRREDVLELLLEVEVPASKRQQRLTLWILRSNVFVESVVQTLCWVPFIHVVPLHLLHLPRVSCDIGEGVHQVSELCGINVLGEVLARSSSVLRPVCVVADEEFGSAG